MNLFKLSSLLIIICGLSNAFAVTGRGHFKQLRKKLAQSQQTPFQTRTVHGVTRTVKPIRRTTAELMQNAPHSIPKIRIGQTPPCPLPGCMSPITTFNTANYGETGQYGPSADGAVGTTQFFLASKGDARTIDKVTLLPDGVLNLSHDRFFSSISNGGFTADPNILFDAPTQRWFLACDGNTNLLLAYSDGLSEGAITSSTVWTFLVVDTVFDPGFEFAGDPLLLPAFFDYATLGVDNFSVLVAADVLNPNPVYFSSAAYLIDKTTLDNTAVTITSFLNLVDQTDFSGPISLQGAQNFDTNIQSSMFIGINALDFLQGFSLNTQTGKGQVLISTVNYTNQTPTSFTTQSVPVNPFIEGIPSPALGTPATHMVDGVTTLRPSASHIRYQTLYSCTYIGVDNMGTSTEGLTVVTRNGIRFWSFITEFPNQPPGVMEGTIFTSSLTNDFDQIHFLTPSIMTNCPNGCPTSTDMLPQVLIGSTTCGTNAFLNATINQVTFTGPFTPPIISDPCIFTSSKTRYYATEDWEFSFKGRNVARWGDHTRITPDPTDNLTFYTCCLFCEDTDKWGSITGVLRLPPPAAA
jgi:hypothetical protein